jgi:hypothetical protein
VLNKKPPQGWPQALRKRRQIDVGRGRRTSLLRLKLLESPKMMTTERRR